jgi:hypothetical protein
MTQKTAPLSFSLYRWKNPETRCDHPFLAIAEDKSALLELGGYHLSVEAGVPDEHAQWLTMDFAPTDTQLTLDLSLIRRKINSAFACDADFMSVRFDSSLRPTQLDLSLPNHDTRTEGHEYLLKGPRSYQRIYRFPWKVVPVSAVERVVLEVFFTALTDLGNRYSQVLSEPLPPRYRRMSSTPPFNDPRPN